MSNPRPETRNRNLAIKKISSSKKTLYTYMNKNKNKETEFDYSSEPKARTVFVACFIFEAYGNMRV